MDNPKLKAEQITLEDFTDTVLGSVGRAIDARVKAGTLKPIGPILMGIIWWPEGGPMAGQIEGQATKQGRVAK
jgi:hypothetical protein